MADDSRALESQPTTLTGLLASICEKAASPAQPTGADDDDKDPALDLLQDVQRASQLADALSLFSDNDSLRDLPTPSLRALLIHSIWGEAATRVRTKPSDTSARRATLQTAKTHYASFIRTLFALGVIPTPDASSPSELRGDVHSLQLLSTLLKPFDIQGMPSSSSQPATSGTVPNNQLRRELKVALFKLERSVKASLDQYRTAARDKHRLRSSASSGAGLRSAASARSGGLTGTDLQGPDDAQWDLLVLPQVGAKTSAEAEDEDDDEEDEETFVLGNSKSAGADSSTAFSPGGDETPTSLRAYLVLLLRLHALLAHNQLAFIQEELSLLANIPASAQRDAAERQAREEAEAERRRRRGQGAGDDEFDLRIESRFDASAPGPLLDSKGKPLRPFTITSSGSKGSSQPGSLSLPTRDLNERRRLHDSVFQPSHRLPTMTIDEYLEEEERRGNILTGGGAEGAAKPTPREAREVRAEMDGTLEAEEAREEGRQEAIYWDEYREANKRGAGNTMNRG
ncbi:unnamed protein product [Parajaminaea phylloscopi]